MNKTDLIKKLDRKYNWISAGLDAVSGNQLFFTQEELLTTLHRCFYANRMSIKEKHTFLDELIEISTNERNLNPINYL